MSEPLDWVPANLPFDKPNAARVYDYLLGGGCNFEADRLFADKLIAAMPGVERVARDGRAFLRRAVRFCVANGVRQFLDLGSGIPSVGNVHEVAQDLSADCRVVYVDNDSIAVAHSELMLDSNDLADVVLADLLDVDTVLDSEPVRRLINFDEPMAALLVSVLHFVPDRDNPGETVARYVDAMASGSYLVLSHGASESTPEAHEGKRLYAKSGTPAYGRTHKEVKKFMAATELVDPGLVWTYQWRPDSGSHIGDGPELLAIHGAVGRKP